MSLVWALVLRVVVFFFSSRRRHTRVTCDWSSDVCSSDLCPDDAVEGLSFAPLAPGGIITERHLLSGVGEKVPELDALPLNAFEVPQDAEGDVPLALPEVAVDIVGAEAGVASGTGRDKLCCAAQQPGN